MSLTDPHAHPPLKTERRALFSSPEFESMLGSVQHCSDASSRPKLARCTLALSADAHPTHTRQASSHPKLARTVELLEEHFSVHGANSRVMVFTTYRSAVTELLKWLGGIDGVRPMQVRFNTTPHPH